MRARVSRTESPQAPFCAKVSSRTHKQAFPLLLRYIGSTARTLHLAADSLEHETHSMMTSRPFERLFRSKNCGCSDLSGSRDLRVATSIVYVSKDSQSFDEGREFLFRENVSQKPLNFVWLMEHAKSLTEITDRRARSI